MWKQLYSKFAINGNGVQNIQAWQKTASTNQRLAWTERDVSLYPTLLKSGIIVLLQKPSPAIV